MSKGGGGSPNSENDGQGEEGGVKKSNILPDVLCEWPFTKFCRCKVAILEPL